MCGADTQMFLSVSASIAREMSCTQMWQYPGVLCNTPGEFYSLSFFFFSTTISATLGPLLLDSDLFFFSIANSSTARHMDAKHKQLFYIVVNGLKKRKETSSCFGSGPGDDESERVIANEVSPSESVYG